MHKGHRSRLRNRFVKYGFEGFEKHELIELYLTYSIPRRNTNDTAHDLIERFGSLNALFEADEKELLKVNGIGPNSVLLIKLLNMVYKSCQEENEPNELMPRDKIYTYIKQNCISKMLKTFLLELDASFDVLKLHVIKSIDYFNEENIKNIIKGAINRFTRYILFCGNYILNSQEYRKFACSVKKVNFYFASVDIKIIDCIILNKNNECVSVMKEIFD